MPVSVEVVTAERVVFSDDNIDEVIAPGVEGQLGVLPRHAAFMTMLEPGELRLVKGEEEIILAVTGGFLEVRENKVMILADAAERAEEIDLARAEEARRRAEERLAARDSAIDLAKAEAALRRAVMRLGVAERRRRRPGAPRPG
jgi:F-type H+-transporting ATPase subunit epsilon